VDSTFKRLPYNYCALSLQPFTNPVCTASGTIFDHESILTWLAKHGTNPVDGQPLKSLELIKLHIAKNDDGEFVDPVTFKVFTNNTHIVTLRNTGNVFAWDTVERLNIKAKNWCDLVSDDEFSRKDLITLQDPQNIESRNLSAYKHLKDGNGVPGKEPEENVNTSALGSAAKILKAKEAVAKARAEREKAANPNRSNSTAISRASANNGNTRTGSQVGKPLAYNAAQHTTGKAAASFTSTGLTPHTGAERAVVSDEDYMLKPKRVKITGYIRMQTNHGDLNIELYPEYAPKAVWNFIQLAKKGYYSGLVFHRNIRNFMIQGGDPTGTGRGGSSIWGKNFNDEFDGPLTHDSRGILAMANKGKNTNSSQFFITYRGTKHLDKKHTIFGRVVDGLDVLTKLENVKGDDKDKPLEDIKLIDIQVFLDPFEEFMKQKANKEAQKSEQEAVKMSGGTEDDKVTWTGKRIRDIDPQAASSGVGKYLSSVLSDKNQPLDASIMDDTPGEPVKKKVKSGGFGNFDGW